MELIEAIKTRKSIRDFKPDPVPKDILAKILEIAVRAPSGVNKQPWEFAVIGGEVLEKIKQANSERINANTALKRTSRSTAAPESVFRQRQVELAKELFRLMGIPREDKEKRAEWFERGFRYFNAPAAIILLRDMELPESRGVLDMGAVMQTICLTALEFGLGTCIEGQGIHFTDILKKYADIPDSKRFETAIAIGYPNWDFPANGIVTTRVPIEDNTYWSGFD